MIVIVLLLVFAGIPLTGVFAAEEDYYVGDIGYDSKNTITQLYFTANYSGVAAKRVEVYDKNNVLLKTFTNPGFSDGLEVNTLDFRYIIAYFSGNPESMAYARNSAGNKITLVKNGALPVAPTPQPTVEPTPISTPEPTVIPTPTPEVPSGDRAILVLTLTTGIDKEFDLTMTEVNAFLNWYDTGSGSARYGIDKHNNNKGPFSKRTEYVIHDKILTFEVSEYTTK